MDCSKPIWTSSWADHQQPALVHLPLTLCDRPLGPLLLPLLLHQATLEQGAVSNAAAVATEGQQRRHAAMQELQHTRTKSQIFSKIRFEGSPKETKSNYYYFPCLNCNTKTSIRHGTFFEAKNTGLRTIILLIYNFVMVSSLTISQKIHEVIIVGFY